MRIIDEQPFEIEFTCVGCKSTLVAEAHDIVGGWDDDQRVYYVTCPTTCGKQHYFERTELPEGIIFQADLKG